jgi:carbamate kinase
MELVVIALGGNALLQRGDSLSAENQYKNIDIAAKLISRLAEKYRIAIVHGNGPQVGLLALQNMAYREVPAYPLDVLVAETQGMIGCMLAERLQQQKNMPAVTTVLTRIEVDEHDSSFADPTKYVGPVYQRSEADSLQQQYGWQFKADGSYIRRVVPSPKPKKIIDIDAIKLLLEQQFIVIGAGGGGIPVVERAVGYEGIEAVIDKDLAATLLATQLKADHLMILTDADAVYLDWGTPQQKALRDVTPDELKPLAVDDGSIGPKVSAAIQFVESTGNRAYIGALQDAQALLDGTKGTRVAIGIQ